MIIYIEYIYNMKENALWNKNTATGVVNAVNGISAFRHCEGEPLKVVNIVMEF